MSGRRQNEVDLMATKGDIIKDIVADIVSTEVHHESGIACTKRENAEIRLNIIKLEELVKTYDLNNPKMEVELYEKEPRKKKTLKGMEQLKTLEIVKADLDAKRAFVKQSKEYHYNRKKKGKC